MFSTRKSPSLLAEPSVAFNLNPDSSAIVPVLSCKDAVLSAVGSSILKVVSCASAVAPSNINASSTFTTVLFTVVVVPDTVRLPAIVKFLNPVKSLFESTMTALLADIVPAVIPSTKFNSDAVEVTPSSIFSSAAVAVTFVPPMSRVVTESSPATVTIPSASAIKSVSSVCPIVVPLIKILSTVSEVRVPTDVRLDAVMPLARVLPVKSAAAAAPLASAPINFTSRRTIL